MEAGNPQVWDLILPMEDLVLNLWDDNQQVWYSCVLCLESHHRAPMDTVPFVVIVYLFLGLSLLLSMYIPKNW